MSYRRHCAQGRAAGHAPQQRAQRRRRSSDICAGAPIAFVSACGASGCGAVLGTLTMASAAVAASVTDPAATYREAGTFNLQLLDDSFASIDAGD